MNNVININRTMNSSNNPLISVVIPVFNERDNIHTFYKTIYELFDTIDFSLELIFVNDGSNDDSEKEISSIVSLDQRVKAIHFTRNFGQQAALIAGISIASGEAVITMDCDLQDPIDLIPQMLDKWSEGYRIVYARRIKRQDSLFKRVSASIYYKLLQQFSEVKIPTNIGEFRLVDKCVIQDLDKASIHTGYLRGMIAWLGYEYAIVNFERPNRKHGKTGFSLLKMLRLAMSGILNFSLIPLRIGLFVGIFTIITGIIFLIYLLVNFFVFDEFYKLLEWLAVTTYIFIGFLFILMWIISEYIGRIYKSNAGMPTYVIRKTENLT